MHGMVGHHLRLGIFCDSKDPSSFVFCQSHVKFLRISVRKRVFLLCHTPALFQIFYVKHLFLLINITPSTFDKNLLLCLVLILTLFFLLLLSIKVWYWHILIILFCSVVRNFAGKLKRRWETTVRIFLRKSTLVLPIIHFFKTLVKADSQCNWILMSESS